ncbi:MAG: glycosyltransferase family 4 protein [Candidatus Berkelbacteria bacterium]|nr:glycosyltransferase family 4 protein [Candidatus Berkelbacteria bacterium]
MKKIKVVYYNDAKTRDGGIGGSQKHLFSLLENLDQNKFKPYLICPNDSSLKKWRDSIRGLKVKVYPIFDHQRPLFVNIKAVRQKLKEIKPKIIHLQFWTPYSCAAGLVASKLAKVPLIMSTEHSLIPIGDSKWYLIPLKAIYQIMRKKIINYPTTVSLASKKMMKHGQFFGNKKIFVIHNGISLSEPQMKPILTSKIDQKKVNFVTVARINGEKGHDDILRTIKCINPKIRKKIHFHFIGDGEKSEKIKKKSREMGFKNKITFWGTRNDVRQILPQFNIFLFPSLRENFPLAILEAMAAGLPIIATDVGGISEALKQNKGGFLVPIKRIKILAQKIIFLATHHRYAERMGKFNSNLVRILFSDKIMTRKTEKLYEDAIRDSKKRKQN